MLAIVDRAGLLNPKQKNMLSKLTFPVQRLIRTNFCLYARQSEGEENENYYKYDDDVPREMLMRRKKKPVGGRRRK